MKYYLKQYIKNNEYLLQYFNTKKEATKAAIKSLKYGVEIENYKKPNGFNHFEIEKVELWKEYKNKKTVLIGQKRNERYISRSL